MKIQLFALSLLLAPSVLLAQTTKMKSNQAAAGSSRTNIESLKKPQEKLKDIDNEITDARMRATLGSKSKFSFKSSLSYSGGSINDPLSPVRPNYRASATIEAMTSLSGDVGFNYRITDKDNLSFGTGITVIDPLHGDLTKSADDPRYGAGGSMDRYQISTPYLSWSRGYRALDTQMISSVTYSHATDSDSVNKTKVFGSVSLSQTILANFGKSKWTGGTSITLGKNIYSGDISDEKLMARMAAGTYKRSDFTWGLFPFMQYSFTDRYSFRTVFGYFQFTRYEGSDDNIQLEPYQSVGLGISITRDIYLYPNVQFTPRDIRSDRTNVALSANLNLF